jgi:hypothetical protein
MRNVDSKVHSSLRLLRILILQPIRGYFFDIGHDPKSSPRAVFPLFLSNQTLRYTTLTSTTGHIRKGLHLFFASGFATSRAQSIKARASGLKRPILESNDAD